MIAITKDEKLSIQERYPWVHIVRTVKHDSKRHHYFMEEAKAPMNMLRVLRGEYVPIQPERKRKRRFR